MAQCRPIITVAIMAAEMPAQVFAANLAPGDLSPKLEQFVALVSGATFKPLACKDLGGTNSAAFRPCLLVEVADCFHVQTQAEDRDPSIFAFAAHFKPACSTARIMRAEAAFLEVFLTCGNADHKAKAISEFLSQSVDLSAPGAEEIYFEYVNKHDAYPGYQLASACPGMTGVNIHSVFDGYPHHGIALYDISKSSQNSLQKPKAN